MKSGMSVLAKASSNLTGRLRTFSLEIDDGAVKILNESAIRPVADSRP
jgi:hypothetical protein